jgi:hypothetical protein
MDTNVSENLLPPSSGLKMAARSSETLVAIHYTTRLNKPEKTKNSTFTAVKNSNLA